MALFKDLFKDQRSSTHDITVRIAQLHDIIEDAKDELGKLDEQLKAAARSWRITDIGRQKAIDSLFQVGDSGATFYTDMDGTHMRFDRIKIIREKNNAVIEFSHGGVKYVSVATDAPALEHVGDELVLNGIRGESDISFTQA